MTSILEAICRIYRNDFKSHYFRNKRLFLFFIAYLKYSWNFEHFRKRDEYPSLIIYEIIDAERRGYLNV